MQIVALLYVNEVHRTWL